jgi:hypothetical protein
MLYHSGPQGTIGASMRVAGFVAVLACAFGAAQAADLSQTGPNATAHALIAARPAVQEPGLEFVYTVKGGDAPGTLTVDMAQDFTVVSREPTKELIYDYALRRILVLDDGPHNFQNDSLYAMVDFYAAETYNRRYLRKLLSAAGAKTTTNTNDPFWVQSELHVMDPEDGVPTIGRRAGKDGSIHFSYDGKEVASYMPGTQALTKDQAAAFARFLRMTAVLHPTIIDDITASGHLPKTLAFTLSDMQKKRDVMWTFQSAVAVKDAYPLQSGAHPVPSLQDSGGDKVLASLIPVMQSAIAGTAPGHKSAADFHAAIDAAMNKNQLFQATVLGFEFNLQYGEAAMDCAAPCHSLKEVFTAAKADPRAQALVTSLQPASPAEFETAIKTLTDMKRDDLSNPYMVDDFLGNILTEARRGDDALPFFANAIKGNPYVPGFYKDIGDAYREGFEPDAAWLCYDFGRSLPQSGTAPVLADMNAYEANLEQKYPQFF